MSVHDLKESGEAHIWNIIGRPEPRRRSPYGQFALDVSSLVGRDQYFPGGVHWLRSPISSPERRGSGTGFSAFCRSLEHRVSLSVELLACFLWLRRTQVQL